MHNIIKLSPNSHSSPALISKSCERKRVDPGLVYQRNSDDVPGFEFFFWGGGDGRCFEGEKEVSDRPTD